LKLQAGETMSAPLDGIRVLDFTRVLAGPFASMILADLGADVVKVEHPERPDDTRRFAPPFADGVSSYFLSINRGKRAIALDLKSDDGKAKALALAKKADVIIENFRPGVMARMGLGHEALRSDDPRLVYCSISGFGQGAGPRAGYDVVVQGLSGIPHLTGAPETPPFKCGTSIADLIGGLSAVQGILAALFRCEHTGEGAFIDVSMLDGQRSLLTYQASSWLNAGVEPARIGNDHPSIHPYSAYQASDGYFNIAVGNETLWERFCAALTGLGFAQGEELASDARFAGNPDRVRRRDELNAILAPVFAERTIAEWLEALEAAGIPAGRIATVPEALADAELAVHAHPEGGRDVRTLPLPYRMTGAPRAATRRPPRLGEHTEEVLADWLE
jgi:formyl-CoA transferase